MEEIWKTIEQWRQAGKAVALATVIKVGGSSLRPPGARMAITPQGDISGSVSGGCVEAAVIEEAQAVLRTRQPKLLKYGVSNEAAWEIGLACGGSVEILVESLETPDWAAVDRSLYTSLARRQMVALLTLLSGPEMGKKALYFSDGSLQGSLGALDPVLQTSTPITDCLRRQESEQVDLSSAGQAEKIFVDVFAPPPRLIIVGAVHIAIALVTLARAVGFYTIVVDARSAFATRARFPHADELIVAWPAEALEKLQPDPGTYLVCLSHDDKLDTPALQVALAGPSRYIGVLGSRQSHARRVLALQELGVPAQDIRRINAPVGLDLGARLPEEIALSILAEAVAARHGRLPPPDQASGTLQNTGPGPLARLHPTH